MRGGIDIKQVDVLVFGTTIDEAWASRYLVELSLIDQSTDYAVSYSKKQIIANIYDKYECVIRFVSPKVSLDGLAVKDFYLTSNLLKKGSEEEIEHCIKVGKSSNVKALHIINEAFH